MQQNDFRKAVTGKLTVVFQGDKSSMIDGIGRPLLSNIAEADLLSGGTGGILNYDNPPYELVSLHGGYGPAEVAVSRPLCQCTPISAASKVQFLAGNFFCKI